MIKETDILSIGLKSIEENKMPPEEALKLKNAVIMAITKLLMQKKSINEKNLHNERKKI